MCHQPLCQEEGKRKDLSLCWICVFLNRGRVNVICQERSDWKPIGRAFKSTNKVINTLRPIGFGGGC